ncbi:MAG: PEP-CTERM sorting domain-containing protein [Limisphaerales bacterium]
MKFTTCSKIPGIAASMTLVFGLSVIRAFGADAASDTAANYASSWSATPANLGSGFGAWNNQVINNNNPPYSGTYLDETSYGNSDGVLSAGYAWATYANTPGTVTPEMILSRPFTAGPSGSSSLYNQTFSAGIGSSGVGGSGSSLTVDVGTAFSLSYIGGGADNFWLGVDGGTASAIAVPFADLAAGLEVALSVSGPLNSLGESYTLTFSPFSGGPAIYTTSGSFDSLDYNTSSFTFDDNNTSNNQYLNNLTITPEAVPEPSALVLSGLSGLFTLFAFRRRK